MPGLVPGIHVFWHTGKEDVDGRNKPGHHEENVTGYDAIRCTAQILLPQGSRK